MAVPDKASILEAMKTQSDLGVRRVDDLDLANGRPGSSSRPGQLGHINFTTPPAVPRKVLPIASKWKDAIARGEFDDEDADAVKGLDRIGGGRLHAQNKPAKVPMLAPSMKNFTFRPNGYQRTFPMGMPRMPGAYPPTPEKSIRGASTGLYNPQSSSSGMTSMGIVLNGPVRRFEPGSSPARHTVQSIQQRPPTRSPQTTPTRPFGTQPSQHQPNTLPPPRMLPTPPRDVSSEPPMAMRPKDPEPLEYVHKADIRVGDRLAKGQGTVYLLESSSTDTGTISIYLEGSKYLEYPVLSMFNYITNSEELYPQFKEPDGVSITTTSLVFGSQDKILNFMKALRTLKARKPTSASTPISIAKPQKSTETRTDVEGGPETKQSLASTVLAKEPTEEGRQGDFKNGTASVDEKGDPPTTIGTTRLQPVSPPRLPAAPESLTTDETPMDEGASAKAPICEVTNDLLDLSLPAQVPTDKITHGSRVSTYAMDLGSLETPVCDSTEPETEAEKGQANVSPIYVRSNETNEPSSSAVEAPNAHNAMVVIDRDVDQMTHVQLVSAIENLRGYLLSILPTFEDMCQVLVSVDAADRQVVAKTVYASIRNASNGIVAESEASAKQVLLALLSQAGHLEKRKTIEPPRPDNRTRYTAEEILQLRTKALPPPPQLSKFARMLHTEKYATPHPAPKSKNSAQGLVQNINPKNNPAATPPRAGGHERGASSQSNTIKGSTSRSPAKGFNPKAPVFTNSNIENITAALAAVSLTGAPTAAPTHGLPATPSFPKPLQVNPKPESPAGERVQKGLSGSRWATEFSILPTNASRFTGINIS